MHCIFFIAVKIACIIFDTKNSLRTSPVQSHFHRISASHFPRHQCNCTFFAERKAAPSWLMSLWQSSHKGHSWLAM